MKVLIIDHEAEAAAKLSTLLTAIDPEIEILSLLSSVETGVRWFLSKPAADLIFMDIELEDGSSFDIFREVKVNTPVIVTSMLPGYALKAFKVSCIDYLLKPVEKNALISALYKYQVLKDQFNRSNKKPEPAPQPVRIQPPKFRNRFLIQMGDKIKYIPSAEIAYFKADGNLVYLFTATNDKLIVDQSLEEISNSLDPALFFRINRTFICQVTAIREIRKYFNSRLKIYLSPENGDDEVLVSRNRVQEFLTWLGS